MSTYRQMNGGKIVQNIEQKNWAKNLEKCGKKIGLQKIRQ